MAHIPYVAGAALLTSLVWFSVVVYQVYRDRYRTWTELLFLGMFTFGAVYALANAGPVEGHEAVDHRRSPTGSTPSSSRGRAARA